MNSCADSMAEDMTLFISTRDAVREVVGPVTVLASPVYNPDDDSWLLFGTLPNGSPIAMEEMASYDEPDGPPLSIFAHLRPGDIVVCAGAMRADSVGDQSKWQKSWHGRYHAGGEVYQLIHGKAVDLVRKFYGELAEAEFSGLRDTTSSHQ